MSGRVRQVTAEEDDEERDVGVDRGTQAGRVTGLGECLLGELDARLVVVLPRPGELVERHRSGRARR